MSEMVKAFQKQGEESIWFLDLKFRSRLPFTPREQQLWDRHRESEQRKRRKRGLKLKEFRGRVGLSQLALARVLGIARRTVCYWEEGRHAPREPDCVRLIYLGFDYRRCKWTLGRGDAIRHIGNAESGYVTVDDLLVFYGWWQDDQGSAVGDYTWRRLSKRLDTGGGYAFVGDR